MTNHETTYILVHGAWHGSWCWKHVRTPLRSAGHNVFTPTLTGLGERSHLNSAAVDLSTHIADIVNLIKWEELSDVVLCGHSYAGFVIAGVADQIPDRIRALVFLDAFVPENRDSLMDIVPLEVGVAIRDQAKATGEGWKMNPIPAHILGVRDPHDVAWVDAQCTAQAIATFEERIRLTGNFEHIRDIAYMFPTECHPNLLVSHERAKAKGWKSHTIDDSGHEFMIDHPQEVAEFLLEYVPSSVGQCDRKLQMPLKTESSNPDQKGRTMLGINDEAPNFTAETSQGTINFHDWIGNSWAILFSHAKDFTPVCTAELGSMAGLQPEFDRRNCKIIGLSVDPVNSHSKWLVDIEETQGHKVNYPMIGDPELKVAKLYDMLPADAGGASDGRNAAANATVRTVFVIGPDKKIKLQLSYPMSTGRNFADVLRVLDSLQLTAKHQVSTPANWQPGEDVIISGSVSNEEAHKKYPNGWKAPRPYLRIVPQPE